MSEDRTCANNTPLPGFESRHPSRQELQDASTEVHALIKCAERLYMLGENDADPWELICLALKRSEQLNNALDLVNEERK